MSKEALQEVKQFNRVQNIAQRNMGVVASASSGGCDASCSSSSGSGCDNSNFTPEPLAPITK